jgi:hypothetical protein
MPRFGRIAGSRLIVVLAVVVALIVLAVPVMAANPSKAMRPEMAATTPIEVTGTVERVDDGQGRPEFSLESGGTVYLLDAGPAWFLGDSHPLLPYVGSSVTVAGWLVDGTTVIEVDTVDGVAVRPPGKPPWAGGWSRVGAIHPGWSAVKAERFKAKFGDCFPPGQCKDKPGRGADEGDDVAEPEPTELSEPAPTAAPTDTPSPTDAASPTAPPAPSDVPGPSESPDATIAPGPTVAPAPTATQEPTATPEPTAAP